MAVFVTQCNSLISSFVPNFRIVSHVAAGKSLTGKSLHTDKHYKLLQKRQKLHLVCADDPADLGLSCTLYFDMRVDGLWISKASIIFHLTCYALRILF